jgi:hypothetical protein
MIECELTARAERNPVSGVFDRIRESSWSRDPIGNDVAS